MTAEPDLLPLPAPDYLLPLGPGHGAISMWSENTIRQIVAHATAAKDAEIEALRAEVREAREFRDKMANAIGNDQLRRFIEKHGEPVPLTARMQQAEARAERLAEEVEALRAEVATWEGLHASEVQVRQRWQARAERLAEALSHQRWCRTCAEDGWESCEDGRKADALLHPTAAQENDDA